MNRDTTEPDTTALPRPNAEKWVEFHHEHAAPSKYSHGFVWDMTAEVGGPFATDVGGNILLDFTRHIGAAPLGYNNERVLSKLREFDLVRPTKIAGQDTYFGASPDPETAELPGASHLTDKLTGVSFYYRMDTVFLSNSGAEIIENAMEITYDHEAPARYCYAFEGSFHDRTLGTLSHTKSKEVYTCYYPQVTGIETASFCADSDCLGDDNACDCSFFAGDGSRLRNSLLSEGGHVSPDEVALAVLEPARGVGGYRFPSEASMTGVGDVCDTYDVPLVVDEIQSGIGRTGEMWAADHYPIEPDVIASAKGLRVGATVSWTDVFSTEKNRFGSTFDGGDLLASIQGAFTLDAIEEYNLPDNATERGRQVRELLADDAPDHVIDVRGKGLIFVIGFDTKERHDAVVEVVPDHGLLTLDCGKKTIRLLPPLDPTEREIGLGVGIFCGMMDVVTTGAVA